MDTLSTAPYEDSYESFDEETVAAMREADDIAADNKAKGFKTVEALFDELDS